MFGNVGHNAYWMLIGIDLIGLILLLFRWPETKGISLEHLDGLFGAVDKVEAQVRARGLSTVETSSKAMKRKLLPWSAKALMGWHNRTAVSAKASKGKPYAR
jgi:hypothetical protein